MVINLSGGKGGRKADLKRYLGVQINMDSKGKTQLHLFIRNGVHGNGKCVESPNFKEWQVLQLFAAIMRKNRSDVETTLKEFPRDMEFWDNYLVEDPEDQDQYTALLVAVLVGDTNIISLLCQKGAPLTTRSGSGKGILHVLVDMSTRVKCAQDMFYCFTDLCKETCTDMKNLMKIEFKERDPLVYAVKEGHLPLAHLYLGVFKTVDVDRGYLQEVVYDTTKYTKCCRKKIRHLGDRLSPIEALLHVRMGELAKPENHTVLYSEVWKKWMNEKWVSYANILFLWAFIRLLYLIILCVCCAYSPFNFGITKKNDNLPYYPNHVLLVGEICVMLFAFFSILFYSAKIVDKIISLKWNVFSEYTRQVYKSLHNLDEPKGAPLFFGRVFFISSLLLHLCVLIGYMLQYFGTDSGKQYTNMFLALAICIGFVTTLYFSYLVPRFGHYSIIVGRTIQDIVNFAVFYFVVQLGFSGAMFVIYKGSPDPEHQEKFPSFSRSMFTLFHMAFEVPDPKLLYSSPYPATTVTIFIAYALIVLIMLLNFLIAIMNKTVASVDDIKKPALFLQRLSVAYNLERYCLTRLIKYYCKAEECHSCKDWRSTDATDNKDDTKDTSLIKCNEYMNEMLVPNDATQHEILVPAAIRNGHACSMYPGGNQFRPISDTETSV